MDLTHVTARVANPANPRRVATVRFLVDSGAIYSVVPGTLLRRLGIRSHSTRTFTLAEERDPPAHGDALFLIDGERAASPVIFGQAGDSTLLGTVSLGSLGFMLDPIRRRLTPLPMVLG